MMSSERSFAHGAKGVFAPRSSTLEISAILREDEEMPGPAPEKYERQQPWFPDVTVVERDSGRRAEAACIARGQLGIPMSAEENTNLLATQEQNNASLQPFVEIIKKGKRELEIKRQELAANREEIYQALEEINEEIFPARLEVLNGKAWDPRYDTLRISQRDEHTYIVIVSANKIMLPQVICAYSRWTVAQSIHELKEKIGSADFAETIENFSNINCTHVEKLHGPISPYGKKLRKNRVVNIIASIITTLMVILYLIIG